MSTQPEMRPTWAEIDLTVFDRNIDALNARLPEGSGIIAVLKANAYGHGAIELARRCTPDRVAMIATALLEEVIELRNAGITLPLLVLGPLIDEPQVRMAIEHDIVLGVPGPEELEIAARVGNARVHLKLDTGMGRMGVVEDELPRVVEILRRSSLRLEAIYTHLANADDPNDPFTDDQIARFRTLVETLREAGIDAPLHHVANTPATLRGLVAPGEYARIGIALLRRVLRWRTEIARLKDLPPGHAVGYGTTFRTGRASRIATLPVGYADGYNRLLSNRGEVLVRGKRAPVVGRVSMDLVTIDVTDIDGAEIGDEAILLGAQGNDEIPVEELAAKLGTIPYEVFCSISARVPRVYRNA